MVPGGMLGCPWSIFLAPGTGAHLGLRDRVLQQAEQGPETVAPADLFPLFVGASPVADADLVDSQSALGDLDRDLRFEAEAVFFDRNLLDYIPAEDLIAGLHVAHVHVCQGV